MAKDNIIEFRKPEPFIDDPITDILERFEKLVGLSIL